MRMIALLWTAVLMALPAVPKADGCTSAVVGRGASLSGRTLLWKHRDTGASSNFIDRVEKTDSTMAFVGLFNGGDTDRREVWAGFNSAGFAVINTATYNMQPDTALFKDREGVVMRRALEVCRTVEDFDSLLRHWPAPRGLQATFGVTDGNGGCAYFEVDDYRTFIYPLEASYAIRTNYAFSGGKQRRYGRERYAAAEHLLAREMSLKNGLAPATFLDGLSRSFYHAPSGRSLTDGSEKSCADRGEVIPRWSSTASVVIEGPVDGRPARMFVALGFPPVAGTVEVTLDSVPQILRPSSPEGEAPAFMEARQRRDKCFFRRGKQRFFNLSAIRGYLNQKEEKK